MTRQPDARLCGVIVTQIPRPEEARRLREPLEDGLPGLLVGGHHLGKQVVLREVVQGLDGGGARILWGDLRRPDAYPPERTYRELVRGLLRGSNTELRRRADRIESHYDAIDLIEEADLERCTVALWLAATSFMTEGVHIVDPLLEAWTNRRKSSRGRVPRVVIVAELWQRDWEQIAGRHRGTSYMSWRLSPVELGRLDERQIAQLLKQVNLGASPVSGELRQLLDRLDGHPYLLNLALMPLAARETTVERLLATIESPRGPLSSFFLQMRDDLSQTNLLDHAVSVAYGDQPDDPAVRAAIRAWGVSMIGEKPRFPIIDRIFKTSYGPSR